MRIQTRETDTTHKGYHKRINRMKNGDWGGGQIVDKHAGKDRLWNGPTAEYKQTYYWTLQSSRLNLI